MGAILCVLHARAQASAPPRTLGSHPHPRTHAWAGLRARTHPRLCQCPSCATQLESSGRTFRAGTLHQHTSAQLHPLHAVALLQLAQGLVDTAAEVHLPPAYQPLPLQVRTRVRGSGALRRCVAPVS